MRARRIAIAAAFLVACGAAPRVGGDRGEALGVADDRLWVLAPHPDDEVLMAGELLRAALARGRPVSIVVMTNGDLSCARNGHVRQGETIAALAELGVGEDDVHFLGYPDGWLDALGPVPLDPLPRAAPDGTCGTGDHTYASHGAGRTDVHTLRTGVSGAYLARELEDDLVWLLERERPSEIVTAHGIDRHPDHAMTYVFLRRALERAAIPPPRVLRSVVHQGPCWPNGSGDAPCPDVRASAGSPFPGFAPPLDGYLPTFRVTSPDAGARKRAAIAHYASQLEAESVEQSWLASFARTDEVFFDEPVRGASERCAHLEVHAPEARRPRDVGGGERLVLLDAGGAISLELDGRTIARGPAPHGEPPADHALRLTFDPSPGASPTTELSVWRDGVFWMLAVVPAELLSSDLDRCE